MRSSLSSLVRSVLLEANKTTSDEAVNVQTAVIVNADEELLDKAEKDHIESAEGWARFTGTPTRVDKDYKSTVDKEYQSQARKSHAYVNTDRWREAVVRTYTFLDQHSDVDDVVVIPIAAHGLVGREIFGKRGNMNRARVLERSEAERVLSRFNVSLPPASERSIVVVPVVGAGALVDPVPGTLPSAWMTVHSIFDDDKTSLQACEEVMKDLTYVLDDHANNAWDAIPLLFNCGWSESAFHTAMAAYQRAVSLHGDNDRYYDVLANDFGVPPVGRRYKSAQDVPVIPGKGDRMGVFHVKRPVTDLVGEVMTIAATKPEGFQPVLSRLAEMPDRFLADAVLEADLPPEILDKLKGPLRPRSTSRWDRDSSKIQKLSPDERRVVEALIETDLEEISMMTHSVRDRLAHDLVGKVVLVAVH